MNFESTPEHVMIRQAIREWVSKECPPDRVAELDENGLFPRKLLTKLSKLGFSGLTIPEEYEGEGCSFQGACIVAEEIAYAYPALAGCYAATAFYGGGILSKLADAEQKKRYLPGCAQGKNLVTLAVFEVDDDPEAECIAASAETDGERYRINGQKKAVWLADQASLFLLLARTGQAEDDLSFFCVDAKRPGITVMPTEALGHKGAGLWDVAFEGIEVSRENVLGGAEQRGKGKAQLHQIQDIGLLFVAAAGLGLSRGAFDFALEHAKQRVQFGQAIGRFPAISAKFAENTIKIEAARLLTHQAAWIADQGRSFTKAVAMAKCVAEEAAVGIAMDGLQITGGYGYTMEYPIQRYIRDAIMLFSNCVSGAVLKERLGGKLGLSWSPKFPDHPS